LRLRVDPIALRIVGTEQDFQERHDITLRLHDPEMTLRADVPVAAIDRPTLNPRKPPGWEAAINARADLVFGAEVAGLYTANFLLNGIEQKQLLLMVSHTGG